MFLQRSLRRLFKLVVYTIATWLLVGVLYLAVPSPVLSDSSTATSLRNGQTVIRVFDLGSFFPASDYTQSVKQSRLYNRWSFIVEFKLLHDITTGSQTLMFGGGQDPVDKINAILDGQRLKPTIEIPYYNVSLDRPDSDSISPVIELDIAVGDNDGIVPPYVANADATLLYWWAAHEANPMSFRIRTVSDQRMIEIWPDSYFWYEKEEKHRTPPTLKPLLSIKTSDEDGSLPVFTFSPDSSSPSMFYPIRLGLLLFLLPIGTIGLLLFSVFSGILHGLFDILALVLNIAALGVLCIAIYGVYWWIKNERPRMSVSFTDVRDVLDATLDNVRMRSEASVREQEAREADLEAQNTTVDGSETVVKESKESKHQS
ncbi:hypothetical protein L218DRAFT_965042 [Marasmius fiardii PR-910]|nr:hypothetical protein L218DRAFT_965042 [Marasmius fiardii PR-910]